MSGHAIFRLGFARVALSFLLTCAALCACSADEVAPTQIVVTVSSDFTVPDELDSVAIKVDHNSASSMAATADLSDKPLPRSIGLVYQGGPTGPITVIVTGSLKGKVVVERKVATSFVLHTTSLISVSLDRACAQVSCGTGTTCIDGTCQAVPTDNGHGGDGDGDAGGSMKGDSGTAGDGDAGSMPGDGGSMPVTDGGSNPGQKPSCQIDLPAEGDVYQTGKSITLMGSCTDPESGALTTGISWTSDGDALASGAAATASISSNGNHVIELCAVDPLDTKHKGCAQVNIEVSATAQPSGHIDSVSQMGSSNDGTSAQPFSTTKNVDFVGTGSGAGITLSWSDNLQGSVGTGSQATLADPVVGRHRITLTVTDRNGKSARVSQDFVVLGVGQTQLVEPFGDINSAIDGTVTALGQDDAKRAYFALTNDAAYTFDAGDTGASASKATDKPPLTGTVQDMLFTGQNALYATASGLTVCSYLSLTGVGSLCTTYSKQSGGSGSNNLEDDNFHGLLLMNGSDNKQHLLLGSDKGVFVTKDVTGSAQGSAFLKDNIVNGLASSGTLAWLATDGGLYKFNPVSNSTARASGESPPANPLNAVAADASGKIWVASDSGGLARFDVSESKWLVLRTSFGLASNACNDVAVHHTKVGDDAHDVIWVATDGGVSRFDPTIPAFMTLTAENDGLPSNTVTKVLVLSDGSKLFATDKGIARYTGP
jgi:hypothetical protein